MKTSMKTPQVWDPLSTTCATLWELENLKADLWSAANLQQIVTKLPPKIAVRRSTRKLELQPKEFDIIDLDEWLET